MSTGLVTAISARMLIEQCEALGFNQKTLLSHAKLSGESVKDPLSYISLEEMNLLWSSILHFTKDRMFALHAAKRIPFGAYRVLDYMLPLSSSPKDALARSSRSFALVNSAFMLSLRMHRDVAYLELHSLHENQNVIHAHIEFILGNYLMRLRIAMQENCKPLEVHFAFDEPPFATEYEGMFGTRVRFRQGINRLVFSRELMEVLLPLADPELCEMMEHYAQKRIRDVLHASPTLIKIQKALAHNLSSGNLQLESLARQFGKSCRSLQREIQAHGITYRELLDTVRRDRALSLLRENELPVKEIAARLNFSEASSFCCAFHRWTGKWPIQYRRQDN